MPSIGHIVTPIPVGTRDSPQLSLIFRYRERWFREVKQSAQGHTVRVYDHIQATAYSCLNAESQDIRAGRP